MEKYITNHCFKTLLLIPDRILYPVFRKTWSFQAKPLSIQHPKGLIWYKNQSCLPGSQPEVFPLAFSIQPLIKLTNSLLFLCPYSSILCLWCSVTPAPVPEVPCPFVLLSLCPTLGLNNLDSVFHLYSTSFLNCTIWLDVKTGHPTGDCQQEVGDLLSNTECALSDHNIETHCYSLYPQH